MTFSRFAPAMLAAALAATAPSLVAQAFHASGSAAPRSAAISASPIKDVKPFNTDIREGVLTVDGMTAKVQLNYDVANQPFLYFFMPGSGVAIVALSPIPNSQVSRNAVRDNTLSFQADGHTITLTSDNPIVAHGARGDAWISLDRTSASIGRAPMMGFGQTEAGPYHWPGSMPQAHNADAEKGAQKYGAPPLPTSVLPRVISTSSVTVQGAQQ